MSSSNNPTPDPFAAAAGDLAGRFIEQAIEVWAVQAPDVPFEQFMDVVASAMQKFAGDRAGLHTMEVNVVRMTQQYQAILRRQVTHLAAGVRDTLGDAA